MYHTGTTIQQFNLLRTCFVFIWLVLWFGTMTMLPVQGGLVILCSSFPVLRDSVSIIGFMVMCGCYLVVGFVG